MAGVHGGEAGVRDWRDARPYLLGATAPAGYSHLSRKADLTV